MNDASPVAITSSNGIGHTLAEGLPGRGFPSGSSPRTQHPQPSEVSEGGRQRLGGCTDPDAVGQSGLEPHSRPDKSSEPQGDRDSCCCCHCDRHAARRLPSARALLLEDRTRVPFV